MIFLLVKSRHLNGLLFVHFVLLEGEVVVNFPILQFCFALRTLHFPPFPHLQPPPDFQKTLLFSPPEAMPVVLNYIQPLNLFKFHTWNFTDALIL